MIDMALLDILDTNAKALVAEGKGILAADESTSTMGKRLAAIGKDNTEALRRAWRELMFTTPGIQNCISGVILYEETLYQSTRDQCPFVDLLQGLEILPGIKVDLGLEPFDNSPVEETTKGLDDLPQRLQKYAAAGAKFAKWRALFHITDTLPSQPCIEDNAIKLARYARACQEAGIVPIVEPEVLMEGEHTLTRCVDVMEQVLTTVFRALEEAQVAYSGMLLKPSMVTPGIDCADVASVDVVAEQTLQVLKKCVPADVAGVAFLSGGQSEVEATRHLDAMNRLAKQQGGAPWPLTFSYGRALQQSAMKVWGGDNNNRRLSQTVFYHRCDCNSAAARGEYTKRQENRNPLTALEDDAE